MKWVQFNMKMEKVSYNIKTKPNTLLNHRTDEILSVIFIFFCQWIFWIVNAFDY